MRALRTLLILLVILGGLFVGADRLAVNLAEDEAAAKIRSAHGLSEDPSVEIRGFPFLTQVAGKELEAVDTTLHGLTAQVGGREVTITEVAATFHNVRLTDNFSSAVAERATGTARISYADLTTSLPDGFTVGYAGAERAARNQIKVEPGDGLLGRSLKVSLHSTLSVSGGDTVKLHAEEIPELPLAEDLIRSQTDLNLAVTGLPSGLKLKKAEVEEDGVVLHLAGNGVELTA